MFWSFARCLPAKPKMFGSFPDAPPAARVAAAEAVLKRAMRAAIVEEGRRPDGRGVTDLRQLTGEVCEKFSASTFFRRVLRVVLFVDLYAASWFWRACLSFFCAGLK